MTKMNYNRPIFRKGKEAKIDEGNKPLESPKMTFGKYKGFTISSLPTNYLEWLISITPNDVEAIKYARELAKRPAFVKRLNK